MGCNLHENAAEWFHLHILAMIAGVITLLDVCSDFYNRLLGGAM